MQNKQLLIIKSLGEAINDKPNSDYDELIKAIAPYTLKTIKVKGVLKEFIWHPTAVGTWGWRLYNKKRHSQFVGMGAAKSKIVTDDVDDTTKDDDATANVVIDPFPININDVEDVKPLGGSTGAILVKDVVTDNLYVKKQGSSAEHVKEEYITNKIYEMLGTPVPKVRLYEGAGLRTTMLSIYMPNTDKANVSDKAVTDELKKNFVADCFLSNWDAYNNDNLLIDKDSGKLIRIDNGGGLRFRAKGSNKDSAFTDDVMIDVNSMKSHNSSIVGDITNGEVKSQMADLLAKKDEILDFLEELGETDLRNKLEKRFKSLENKLNQIPIALANLKTLFKGNKSNYKDFTDNEIQDIYDKISLNGVGHQDRNGVGWSTLSVIGKMRGFDGKPVVLSEDDFKTLLQDDDSQLHYRGEANDAFSDQFVNSDHCWYGSVGIFGAGIYSATDVAKSYPPDNNNKAYREAEGYGSSVNPLITTKNFKAVDVDTIDQMMDDEFYGTAYQKAKKEVTDNIQKIADLEQAIKDRKETINKEVDKEYVFDKIVFAATEHGKFTDEATDTDLSDKSFQSVSKGAIDLVNRIKGEIVRENKLKGEIIFKLPHSAMTFTLSKDLVKVSVKQKSTFLPKYNYHYRNFQDWLKSEHFDKIEKEREARFIFDKKSKELKSDLEQLRAVNKKLEEDSHNIKKSGRSDLHPLLKEICGYSGIEKRGFYAILKGYDGMIERHGNSNRPYMIILNRSKLVTKERN